MTTNPESVGVEDAAPPAACPFERVPGPLRDALRSRGFTAPTEVQAAVLDADAGRHDLRISSQTGSGKTVAIGIALAEQLLAAAAESAARRAGPHALVIAPTRELAEQVRSELDWLYANSSDVTIDCVTGGTDISRERRRLRHAPAVLVGTPGRLLDHLRSGALDCGGVVQLVLDEADQMLDMGFREELDAILEALSPERRTHMVSATFPPDVMELVARFQRDALHVEGTRLGSANADIEHVACIVRPADRYAALVNLLLMADGERTLVFVRTRQDTAEIAERLAEDGFSAMAISGDLAQAQRTRTMNAFRRGTLTTLVATDVAARGLDVPDVSQVVQFDPPKDGSVHTHRSGRTGRAGRKGRSVILVPPASERRVRRLLADADVEASWRDAPGREVVLERIDARARSRLATALDDAGPAGEAELARARELLEGRDAPAVVAALMRMARFEPSCAPREIVGHAPHRLPRRPRELRESTRPPRRPTSYAHFTISWGARDGATPRRLLAHVCRRGGITGRSVGAIDVAAHSSKFEVDVAVASGFSSRVRAPDHREPHIVIRALGARRED